VLGSDHILEEIMSPYVLLIKVVLLDKIVQNIYTHTHTYVYVCVCVCVYYRITNMVFFEKSFALFQ